MSSRLALYFLGSPQLFLDNAPIRAGRRKAIALLAYLAIERGQHRRESLSTLLWPDYDQSKAFTNLRHTLWEIQQSIGDSWLIIDREKIGLNEAADIWLDLRQFESLLAKSYTQNDVSLRIPLLVESVNLYRNHFMMGFTLKDAPNFNEWAFAKSGTYVASSRCIDQSLRRLLHAQSSRKGHSLCAAINHSRPAQ
jgi:DNA-binding SARP family transcriptional activator